MATSAFEPREGGGAGVEFAGADGGEVVHDDEGIHGVVVAGLAGIEKEARENDTGPRENLGDVPRGGGESGIGVFAHGWGKRASLGGSFSKCSGSRHTDFG